jgi:AGZA family xanthine/uracil permease-like MFS transporter
LPRFCFKALAVSTRIVASNSLLSDHHARPLCSLLPTPAFDSTPSLTPNPTCEPRRLYILSYLDFIGSSITFVSLGRMAGVVNKEGVMPRSNLAFLADGLGSTIGGLLGTSALTTYVESAAAMREGGRTGFTAVVCACLFVLSIVLW